MMYQIKLYKKQLLASLGTLTIFVGSLLLSCTPQGLSPNKPEASSCNNQVPDSIQPIDNQTNRADFIRQCLENISQIKLNTLTNLSKIGGVSLVILDKNKGKVSVLLGKELAGQYTGKLNFIEGQLGHKNSNNPLEVVLATLYDEVREELGIQLQYDSFLKSLIDVKPSKNYNTPMFFCYISDLSVQSWESMNTKRLARPSLDWKYQEFSEIKFMPIDELSTHKDDISTYVYENIDQIIEVSNQMQAIGVPSSSFPLVKDDIPMMGFKSA